MYTQFNHHNKASKKKFTNMFGKLQQVASLTKLNYFQQEKNLRCKTMMENYDNSTQNNFKSHQYAPSVGPDLLFGLDEKIKDLQDCILIKKQNILITVKVKLQKLMRKYGFKAQQIKLKDLNNELSLLEFIIKKFNQKDIEIAQIWNNNEIQKSSYKQEIMILQKKLYQQSEQLQFLVQKMANLKYILSSQLKQIQDLNGQLQQQHRNNQNMNKEINEIKIQNQTYKKHIDQIQKQERQCRQLLDQIHISYEKKINDLNKKLDGLKIQNNKLTIQISDYKLNSEQFQIKYKLMEQELNKIKREELRWKQRYQQIRIKLLSSEQFKSKQNLVNYIEENYKQKKNTIKLSEDQTKITVLEQRKEPSDQFGNLLDMHIKILQEQLMESGIQMQKLQFTDRSKQRH